MTVIALLYSVHCVRIMVLRFKKVLFLAGVHRRCIYSEVVVNYISELAYKMPSLAFCVPKIICKWFASFLEGSTACICARVLLYLHTHA